MTTLPGLALIAMPTRRRAAVDLAVEIERRGFTGISCPSQTDALGFCLSIAHATTRIGISTSVLPIYLRSPEELAGAAAHVHEIADGRFRLGLGVSHSTLHERLEVDARHPLGDVRRYVAALHAASRPSEDGSPSRGAGTGELPPILLATLRERMVDLAVEIADGAIWANASRRAMPTAAARIAASGAKESFLVADMIFTVVDDDEKAARALNRSHLARYALLPNYRNYWKSAGYEDEMLAVERAEQSGAIDEIPALLGDELVDDVTISGSATRVLDELAAWRDAGVAHPVLVPSSTSGGQFRAIRELFDAFGALGSEASRP
jgi:alkanesulfonate monooxygenase SsuD/methylene tetrahydromethanopterin reductase-like flavin-dependent oxidoreductase (luciferase family)